MVSTQFFVTAAEPMVAWPFAGVNSNISTWMSQTPGVRSMA